MTVGITTFNFFWFSFLTINTLYMNFLYWLLFTFFLLFPVCSQSQSVSPQVLATTGAYQSAGSISLSYTVGEVATQTLTSAGNILTQGFQQPFVLTLNVKCFIEGYYSGAGQMQDVLYNQGVYASPSIYTDTVMVELHQAVAPFALVYSQKAVLRQDGYLQVRGLGLTGQSYFIAIRHRNAIETWSAAPVLLGVNTFYNFSNAANKAYGTNQVALGGGYWAFYSGDLNDDENIDLLDISILETSINNFDFGYFTTDINGDGNVDLLDNPVVDANINQFIYAIKP